MMPAKPKTKPAARRPEWLNKNPNASADDPYWVEMWDSNTVIEEIEISRDEYEALKLHLGKMRGYDLEAAQRSLLAEFAGMVRCMPAAKVRPLVDLLTEVRRKNYVNVNLFEMIKRHTNMDARESLAELTSFFEPTGKITEIHAKQLGKLLSRLGEHGEKSMYRTMLTKSKASRKVFGAAPASLT